MTLHIHDAPSSQGSCKIEDFLDNLTHAARKSHNLNKS
uniref:Uncharacterized protein n=1 Tax=Rhizophora mucronata TaxID=61149 RepID=A0A2P2LB95_RHIMU